MTEEDQESKAIETQKVIDFTPEFRRVIAEVFKDYINEYGIVKTFSDQMKSFLACLEYEGSEPQPNQSKFEGLF